MQAVALTLLSVLLLVDKPRSFVDSASLSLHPNSVDDLQSAFKNSGLRVESQSLDEDVRELHNLKPFTNNLISMQKSSSRLYSDVNGHKEMQIENKQEVRENGHKVGSVEVQAEAKDLAQSPTPATHVHAEVDVPSQGLHRAFDSADKRKAPPRPDVEDNIVPMEGYHSYTGVQYSPLDMAEYVFWTGDEKGVTLALEEFLQDGMMTREEAIAFLQDIKINLDYLQNHYAEERIQKQELAKERSDQLQKALNLEKMAEAKLLIPTDLSVVRQQMRERFSKKSPESAEDAFSPTMNRMSSTLTDDEYQDLLERLREADFLYTEYSLEEIIYQLAKVMFSQSLTRGSSEAQDALQKFTGFLEAEAESGRISRSLEKKVLDVLIASLSDTLTEQPELIGAARVGLGPELPAERNAERNAVTLEKLLILNKANQKSGLGETKPVLMSHRFQNNKTPGDAGVAMKKSVLPAKPHPKP